MKPLNKVFYGILNWGLGHATRSSVVINYLLKNGAEVTIATDGGPLELLKEQFPECTFVELPPYGIRYSTKKLLFPITLFSQMPKMLNTIEREKKILAKYAKENHYDLIISDARFGIHHPAITSVVINHQLRLNTPLADKWVNKFNTSLNAKFDHLWVPDIENGMTREISKSDFPTQYIGWLSHYKKEELEQDIDILVVLSGPEPQRSILEKKLNQLLPNGPKAVLVRGTNSKSKIESRFKETYNLVARDQLNNLLNRAKVVVGRSGYTSLMDYKVLDKRAVIIPTPGQTEQEHLGEMLKDDPKFRVLWQHELSADVFNWYPQAEESLQKESPNVDEGALKKAIQHAGFFMPAW